MSCPLRWLLALCVLVLIVAAGYSWKAVAQSPGDVPIAGFACTEAGLCYTDRAQLERMMAIWYAMQQRILSDCPRGRDI